MPSARTLTAKLAAAAPGGVVTVTRAAEVLGLSQRSAAVKLANLARRGWVRRARRGLYLIVPLEVEPGRNIVAEDPWVVAREAFSPCYIGGWSAAEYWGLTEQIFRPTLVVTAANVRARKTALLGLEFRLFNVPKGRIEGATAVWRGTEQVSVSDRERTIVDCLRHPELCGGIRHLAPMMKEYAATKERDFGKLLATAGRFGGGAAWKRLGYLAEKLLVEAGPVAQEARKHLTAGNVKLDPAVRTKGALVRRWRLWINTSIGPESDT